MQATKAQKKYIHVNTPNRDTKEEWVQWATEDVTKISCNDLSFDQANMIIVQLGGRPHRSEFGPWGAFDKENKKHLYILSLCQQYGWTGRKKGRSIADLEKLGNWLATKSPVKKPLREMDQNTELPRVITAMEQMVKKRYK